MTEKKISFAAGHSDLRLIASDLDGTLLTDDKKITLQTWEVVEEAARRGIQFVPATGRAFVTVPDEVLSLPGVQYVIASNGAAVYEKTSGRRIYSRLLEPYCVELLLALPVEERMTIEVLIDGIPYTETRYVDNPSYFGATEFGVHYVKATRRPVDDLRSFALAHREQIDGIHFVSKDEALLADFRKTLESVPAELQIVSSVKNLLEVGHAHANKGDALGWLLERLGLTTDQAAAFGDADNDNGMLASVYYGTAMGNALDCSKKAARFVTDTNENNGVAKMIRRILDESDEINADERSGR